PEPNFFGSDSFTYKVSDGALESSVATVRIVVVPENDVPVVGTTSYELNEDGSITLDLLAGASDPDGDALRVASVGAALHGEVVRNADGSYTYTPDADYFGSDSFGFSLTDD